MPQAKGDFVWYELLTTDADAAQRFYAGVVGWTVADSGMAAMDYRILDAGDGSAGGMMQLTSEMRNGGARPAWIGYVGVPDVDAALDDWTSAGGSVLMPPMDVPDVGRMAMLADPDGVPIYVMRGATDEASTVFRVESPRHVRWNELAARDDAAALRFYQDRFGWTREGAMPMGPMGDYSFIAANGVTIGAMMRVQGDGQPRWLHYFGVEDIDKAARQVASGGGTVLDGPHEIPGGEFSVQARDPQGVDFGLVGPRNG